MQVLDLLFLHGIVLTMHGNGVGIIEDGAIGIVKDKIVAVGISKDILKMYRADRIIDATNKVIMPGFVDAHIHTGDCLIRGVAQDLNHWMQHGIWPFEEVLRQDEDAVCKSSMLNIVESLKSGTTTFCDFDTPIAFCGGQWPLVR